MLRTLYPLSRFLREKGWLESHPDIRKTNEDRLVLELAADGMVRTVRVTKERTSFLCINNYNAFPAFNLPALVEAPEDFRQPVANVDWMLTAAESWPSSRQKEGIFHQRWLLVVVRFLEKYGKRPGFPESLRRLMELKISCSKAEPTTCLRQLLHQVAAAAQNDAEVAEKGCALFGVIQEGRGSAQAFVPEQQRKNAPANNSKILVDYPEYGALLPDVWEQTTRCLFETSVEAGEGTFQATCALSGKPGACVVSHKTFEVPEFGRLQLYSADKATPALHSYGRSQGYIFPVRQAVAADLAATVKFLWNQESRGKTWRRIPGRRLKARKTSYDVMLMWVEEDPSIPVVSLSNCEDQEKEKFQRHPTEALAELDQRLDRQCTDAHIAYMIVRKENEGIFRNVLCGNYLRSHWGVSMETWARGCVALTNENISLTLDRCVSLLSRSWTGQGKIENLGYAPSLADVWPLYLDLVDSADTQRRLFTLALKTHERLLRLFYQQCLSGEPLTGSMRKLMESDALQVRALLSLFIIKQDKGATMELLKESPAFNLGRLMRQADGMRNRYSIVVRGKALKDTLGVNFSQRALRDPLGAFNDLLARIGVYLSWAKTTNDELAQQFLVRFEEAAEKTARCLEHRVLSDREQAEFWLGFTQRNGSNGGCSASSNNGNESAS